MTDGPELVVRARRVVLRDGIVPAAIHIHDGRIERVTAYDDVARGARIVDAGERVIMPGLVDSHVHCNEPGRTEWEGFRTATRAAAAGGITTIVDMPLNSIPATTTLAALRTKRAAADGQCMVDVAFWGGLVPGNADELAPMAAAGVCGFKCFLVPSGVDEFEAAGESDLAAALPILRAAGVPLLVHAELSAPLERARRDVERADPGRYATWLASRPDEAELEAIDLMIGLARRSGARIHIVHVATSRATALLREAQQSGVPISAETCPHYLHFDASDIADGATEYKCAPPIRQGSHRDGLWSALDDSLQLVASDHSPCPPEMKARDRGDFMAAWGGIASLQLGLSIVWTGAEGRGRDLRDVARWM
ncbi:MAG: allantoinase AllB, partial [Gemmatimonadota bacterium]|nr:allantoinase AllB [Gemmatimonadota bacterium]